tara:strand:+ start:164 stop:427 length:264 start_codon:yes stop_codon:yes gene_type:complete
MSIACLVVYAIHKQRKTTTMWIDRYNAMVDSSFADKDTIDRQSAEMDTMRRTFRNYQLAHPSITSVTIDTKPLTPLDKLKLKHQEWA